MTFENRFVRQPQNELLYTFRISIGSLKTQELKLFYAITITLIFKVVTHKKKFTESTDRLMKNSLKVSNLKVFCRICSPLFLKTTVQTERSALYLAHMTNLEHVSYRTLQHVTKAENKLKSII